MTPTLEFRFPAGWTAADLADAVPMRLHQLLAFDAADVPAAGASANRAAPRARCRVGYLPPAAAMPLFRVVP